MDLKSEFKNLKEPNKTTNVNDFIEVAQNYLNKYNNIYKSSFKIEDDIWTLHNSTSNKYDLYEGEYIFDNSIELRYQHHPKLSKYINKMLYILNNINENIKVKYKYIIDKEYKIMWILFKFSKK